MAVVEAQRLKSTHHTSPYTMPWRQFKEGFKRGFQKVSNFFAPQKESYTLTKTKSLEDFERQLRAHNEKMGYDQPNVKRNLPSPVKLERFAARIATGELEVEVAKGIRRGDYRNAQIQAKVVKSYGEKVPQEVRAGKSWQGHERMVNVKELAENPIVLSRYHGMSLAELRERQANLMNERDMLRQELAQRLSREEREKRQRRFEKVMQQAREMGAAMRELYHAQKPKMV